MKNKDSVLDRIAKNTAVSGKCLVWTGAKNPKGYGRVLVEGRSRMVHRVVFEIANGPIESGMVIDHKCHTPACVKVEHLQAVTPKQNQENRRGANSDSSTGVLGVSWRKDRLRYIVQVWSNGHRYYGGSFKKIQDAEASAVALRNKLFDNNLGDILSPSKEQ